MAQHLGRKLRDIAFVQPEHLSDNSVVFNVDIPVNVENDIHQRIVIGALNEREALRIAYALNSGVAWIHVKGERVE